MHRYVHVFTIMHPYILYVPGSLYAICRAQRIFDGLRGWRMRSHAYSHVYYTWFNFARRRKTYTVTLSKFEA
ncbi:hypothetical protein NC653_020216 [Populus alba x Populus x berolinensis]|uniref:Uncharacterized protein n=1 Tax=Populus alba x Populus x berolinensis TaxID=444605 RepID=A0AAD6MJT8_9ROSI|nr:hypothetical protein NC653_020216 [Populus alba x Populus x berolinensis]